MMPSLATHLAAELLRTGRAQVRNFVCCTAACCAAMAGAGTARAELTWMEPETFQATPGATLWIEVARADEFGASTTAISASSLAAVDGSLAHQTVVPGVFGPLPNLLRFTGTFPRPGIAEFAAELKPEQRAVPHEDVERYLRAVHATDEIRTAWQHLPANANWRELRRERLKTFIRVGEPPPSDVTWEQVARAAFDVTPLLDPTAMHAGEPLTVLVSQGKQPLPGCVVAFVSRGETREHVVLTDDQGRATARLDARGVWLIQSMEVRRVSAADHDWETDVAAMTVSTR